MCHEFPITHLHQLGCQSPLVLSWMSSPPPFPCCAHKNKLILPKRAYHHSGICSFFMSSFCWTEFLTQITATPSSQHIQIKQALLQIVNNLRFQKKIYIMHLSRVHWSRIDELSRASTSPLWHLEAGGRILNDNYSQTPAEHTKQYVCKCTLIYHLWIGRKNTMMDALHCLWPWFFLENGHLKSNIPKNL